MENNNSKLRAKDRLIVALDYDNLNDAINIVEDLGNSVEIYKVGLEIFLNTNGNIIDYLKLKKKKIFLDLKFHDITNTVKKACEYAIDKDIFMFNVHVANGTKTMSAISEIALKKKSNSIILGVTVLTSLDINDINEIYDSSYNNVNAIVNNMAGLVKKSGLTGIVCSAQEAKSIKEKHGADFITVCPGVRPSFSSTDDQVRVMTPYEAIKNGADYLVIGRPITSHSDPRTAVEMICSEMEGVKI